MTYSSVQEVTTQAIALGFVVYLSGSNEYGFFTDASGSRIVSFGVDISGIHFSGNYESLSAGTGWRLNADDILKAWKESQHPPSWATKCERVRLTSSQDHLERYGKTSKYSKIEG